VSGSYDILLVQDTASTDELLLVGISTRSLENSSSPGPRVRDRVHTSYDGIDFGPDPTTCNIQEIMISFRFSFFGNVFRKITLNILDSLRRFVRIGATDKLHEETITDGKGRSVLDSSATSFNSTASSSTVIGDTTTVIVFCSGLKSTSSTVQVEIWPRRCRLFSRTGYYQTPKKEDNYRNIFHFVSM
jgi:hypothetical protein